MAAGLFCAAGGTAFPLRWRGGAAACGAGGELPVPAGGAGYRDGRDRRHYGGGGAEPAAARLPDHLSYRVPGLRPRRLCHPPCLLCLQAPDGGASAEGAGNGAGGAVRGGKQPAGAAAEKRSAGFGKAGDHAAGTAAAGHQYSHRGWGMCFHRRPAGRPADAA